MGNNVAIFARNVTSRPKLTILSLLTLAYVFGMLIYIRSKNDQVITFGGVGWTQLPVSEDTRTIGIDVSDELPLNDDDEDQQSRQRVILQWTRYFGHSTLIYDGQSSEDMLRACPVRNCRFTLAQNEFDMADALIFHGPDLIDLKIYPEHRSWRRRPEQLYVYMESPALHSFEHDQQISTNYFNLTMTYRLDSDFPKTYAKASDFPAQADKINETNFYNQKRPDNLAVMFVSTRCSRSLISDRMPYAYELQRILGRDRVKIYGKCTNDYGGCPRDGPPDCMEKILGKTFFYLALENSICTDYVTEKLYRALANGIVPIVNNRRVNYDLHAPRGSYIHTRDFDNATQLAAYLERVAQNETLYNEYMVWRQNEQSWLRLPMFKDSFVDLSTQTSFDGKAMTSSGALCNLCAALNEPLKFEPKKNSTTLATADEAMVIEDIVDWWSAGQCDSYGEARHFFPSRWPADELPFDGSIILTSVGVVVLLIVVLVLCLRKRHRFTPINSDFT